MNHQHQTTARSAETTEELIGVLTAISIVSKRLAKNLALMEQSQNLQRSSDDGTTNRTYTATG